MARRNEYALAVEVGNTALTVTSRQDPPTSDELILAIGHTTYGGGRTAVLSRSKAQEIYDFLGRWLANGWPGVPQVDGESNADVVQHFQDIAIRAQLDADHARTDAGRQVAAAIACIPPERRTDDLEKVAQEQAGWWARQQKQLEVLETARLALIDIEFSTTGDADAIRKAAGKRVTQINAQLDRKPTAAQVEDAAGAAPIYLDVARAEVPAGGER